MPTLSKPRTLICCCCGKYTLGRQWWNRDTGYGLCAGCIDLCKRNTSDIEFESCYGVAGVHYALCVCD